MFEVYHSMKLYLIIFLVFLLSGCSNRNNESAVLQHPVKEYIPHHEWIRQNDDSTQPGEVEWSETKLEDYISSVTNAVSGFPIGRESGKQTEILGSVTDVETDSDNNIYVLDGRGVSIRKYDSAGTLLNLYGGTKGRGPTDLYRPADIELGAGGNIYVADVEIKILHNTDQGIEYKTSMLTPGIIPADICILGDELFIRTVAENKAVSDTTVFNLVHVYSLKDHTYLRGFGSMYKSPRLDTNRRLSGGFAKIACQESTDTIVYGFEFFSYLYGYSSQGRLKWVTKMDPFQGYSLKETVPNGGARRWLFLHEGDIINSITPFMGDFFLVQVGKTLKTGEDIETKLRSYLVSSNGKTKKLGEVFPRVWDVNETILITPDTSTPYPGVNVFNF